MAVASNLDSVLTRGRKVATYSNTGSLTIYVDGVLGDDNNDGLSPTPAPNAVGPLKTIDAIYGRIPMSLWSGNSVVVNLAANGLLTETYSLNGDSLYFGGGNKFTSTMSFIGPEMVPAILATGPTTAALDVVPAVELNLNNASGVATPLRTRLDFTAAAPGWTVNDMSGRYFIRVKRAGVKRYFELPISGNTASSIFIDSSSSSRAGGEFVAGTGAIVGDLLATDTVEIVQPGAIISGNFSLTGQSSVVPFLTGVFGFANPGFKWIGFDNFNDPAVAATYDRCAFNGVYFTTFASSHLVNCAMRNSGLNWGGAHTQANGFIFSIDSVTYPNPSVCVSTYASFMTLGCGTPGLPDQEIPGGGGLWTSGLPVSFWNATYPAGQHGALNSAITAAGPAAIALFLGPLLGNIDPAASPGSVGIRATLGAQIIINSALTSLIGDPAAGDLKVGLGAPIYYGTGAGQYKEVAGYNGHFTRLLENAGDVSRISDQSPL